MKITELETPALLIDLDIMERNLNSMAAYTKAHGLRLRPHTKTHKTPALARRQMELGAVGITVAKVGEAEVMVSSSPNELLVAYPVIGGKKLHRLMDVAKHTNLTVSLDSVEAAQGLSDAAAGAGVTVGVLVEIDAGMGRVGVTPGPQVIALAKAIDRMPNLEFRGIAFYPGHIKLMDDAGHAALARVDDLLSSVISDLKTAGFAVPIVSGGSTPTMHHLHEVPHMNEARPGTYIFNDRNTIASGACKLEDCAASILLTVVSTAVPGQMIIDGGSKTFSSDGVGGGATGFGHLVEAPEAVFEKMNEEHGYVKLKGVSKGFKIGDRVRMIPNHVCVAVNLHERIYGVRGDEVEETWKVEARGKLQ
jgi:D-serine deaminase-like pyridoxal phosphate-dependent protein